MAIDLGNAVISQVALTQNQEIIQELSSNPPLTAESMLGAGEVSLSIYI